MKLSEFKKKFGEGTDFDLDWGKLVILGLCIYIAVLAAAAYLMSLKDKLSLEKAKLRNEKED